VIVDGLCFIFKKVVEGHCLHTATALILQGKQPYIQKGFIFF
jgi:hypothetical protein